MNVPLIQTQGGQQGQHGHPGAQGGNQGRFPAPPIGPQGGQQGRPAMHQQNLPGGQQQHQAGLGNQIGYDQTRLLQSNRLVGRHRPKQEVHDIHSRPRSNEEAAERLSSHVAIRLTKAGVSEWDEFGFPVQPSWDKAVLTDETEFSEKDIVRKIRSLNNTTAPVLDKKGKLTDSQSSQLDYVKTRLENEEEDEQYEYKLVQFETRTKKMPHSPVADPRYLLETSNRGKYRGRSRSKDRHRSKDKNKVYIIEPHRSSRHKPKRKRQTVSITAYFKRIPKNLEWAMDMFDEREGFDSAQRPRPVIGQSGPGGQPHLNRVNQQVYDQPFQQGQAQLPQVHQGQFPQQGFPQQGGHQGGHQGGQGFPPHGHQPGGQPGHPQGHPQGPRGQGPQGGGMQHPGQQNMMNNPNMQQRPQMNQPEQRQGPQGPHPQQQHPQRPQQQPQMRPPIPPQHPHQQPRVVPGMQAAGNKKGKEGKVYNRRSRSRSSSRSSDASDSQDGYNTPDTSGSDNHRRQNKKRSHSRDRRGRRWRREDFGQEIVRRHHEKFARPEPPPPTLIRPNTPPSPIGRMQRAYAIPPPRVVQDVRRGPRDPERAARFRNALADLDDEFQGMSVNDRPIMRGGRAYDTYDYDDAVVYAAPRRGFRREGASDDGVYRGSPRYRRNFDDYYPEWRGQLPRMWNRERVGQYMRDRPRSVPEEYDMWSEAEHRGRFRPASGMRYH